MYMIINRKSGKINSFGTAYSASEFMRYRKIGDFLFFKNEQPIKITSGDVYEQLLLK